MYTDFSSKYDLALDYYGSKPLYFTPTLDHIIIRLFDQMHECSKTIKIGLSVDKASFDHEGANEELDALTDTLDDLRKRLRNVLTDKME